MRNMSFRHTKKQILEQTKTVTRRLGWRFLKRFDLVQPVERTMGLKKGEKVKKLGPPIRIVSVRREWLWDMKKEDVAREGFKGFTLAKFMYLFCRINDCEVDQEVTRIEFEYTKPSEAKEAKPRQKEGG